MAPDHPGCFWAIGGRCDPERSYDSFANTH
jgi:hypothetical protein